MKDGAEPAGAPRSPRIRRLEWGRIETEDGRSFKDAKLWPGGGCEWDWNETGTRHEPGIQPADVAELLERGSRVVVLSRGVHERLGVCPETLEILRRNGIEVRQAQTERAVELYNELVGEQAVGGLFHSTC